MKSHSHARLDRVGFWFSMLCAIHCMVMPFVLVFLPLITFIRWSKTLDAVIFAIAVVIGLIGCGLGLRHHKKATPIFLVIFGLSLSAVGRFLGASLGQIFAQTLLIAGPSIMAYGLWRDRQICKCKSAENFSASQAPNVALENPR